MESCISRFTRENAQKIRKAIKSPETVPDSAGPVCGEDYHRRIYQEMGAAPMPWCTDAGRGDKHQREKKCFLVPSEIQKAAAEVEIPEEIPPERFRQTHTGSRPQAWYYGICRFVYRTADADAVYSQRFGTQSARYGCFCGTGGRHERDWRFPRGQWNWRTGLQSGRWCVSGLCGGQDGRL